MAVVGGNLLVVDEHRLRAESLARALAAEGFRTAEAATIDGDLELLRERTGAGRIDGAILTVRRHDGGISFDALHELARLPVTLLVLGDPRERALLAECIEIGAQGVFTLDLPLGDLVEVVGAALRGETVLTATSRAELLAALREQRDREEELQAMFGRLTLREAAVLGALIEGKAAEQIAADNVVAVSTVRSHIKSVLVKLGVNSQLAAVAIANRAGWPGPRNRA